MMPRSVRAAAVHKLPAVVVAIAIASCSDHFIELPFLAPKTKSYRQSRVARNPLVNPHFYKESKSTARPVS